MTMGLRSAERVWWPVSLALVVSLGGCGFHLQGRNDLPKVLANARIETQDRQSDFYSALRASLISAGAALDGVAADVATIKVIEDEISERVLTVSARNIPTAYQLSYRIKIAVESKGRELMAPEEHVVTREYNFDERAMLAKQREREALAQALADDLAALVMRRLSSL